jgi:hypothetical protein
MNIASHLMPVRRAATYLGYTIAITRWGDNWFAYVSHPDCGETLNKQPFMAAGDQAAESMARTFIEVLIESKK